MKTKPELHAEIIAILEPLFGKSFISTVDKLYEDESDPEELLGLTHKLLVGYLGDQAANAIMGKLLKKYNIEIKLEN